MSGPSLPPGPGSSDPLGWGRAPGAGQPLRPAHPPTPPAWAAPVQERRRSRWLTIGLPAGVLLVLGGCGAAAILAVTAFTGTLGPAMAAGEAYAGALVQQRWGDAHGMLCDDVRAGVTPEQLAAQYGRPPLTGYSVEGVHVHASGGQSSAEVTVRFATQDGLDELALVPLVRDGDGWRPCP